VPIQSVSTSAELAQTIRDLSLKEANLRAARVTFTDSSRVVQTLVRDVQTLRSQQLPQLTADLIADLRQREGDLSQQIDRAATEIRGIPARTIEEQRLRRNVASKDALYQNIQTKYEGVRLQALSTDDAITVLDTAIVPQRPTTNKSAQIILMAFGASLALGIGGALALDLMDKRFRYPEQATGELGLPIVGAVPALVTLKSGASDPEEDSQVVEAFRTIRMNLIHAFDGAGSIVLTVSSPGPGDGKSLVAMNLAMRFAELGHHVLLVDGDIRRGELHETFEVARRPGLVDYLAGTVPLDSVLRETSADNLTLIPCGSRRHRGPELLQSPVLGAFIEQMKTRYDVIIVDSPPLGVGVDPFVIGSATGNMLLVLRSGETDRKLALARLRVIQRLPIRVVGAVLNGFSAEGAYRYYAHLYGYDMPEEDSPVPQLASKSEENGA
ncbi:MAG: polysaccharide biosynthesis tyrosine autokinase, partial [Gemmatimonadaceae bacterium]